MGECKSCKVHISDVDEYCNECLGNKGNESYLDSLLNSMMSTSPSINSVYKKTDNRSGEENISNLHQDEFPINGNTSIDNSGTQEEFMNREFAEENKDSFLNDDNLQPENTEDYSLYDIDNENLADFDEYNIDEELKSFNLYMDEDTLSTSEGIDELGDFTSDYSSASEVNEEIELSEGDYLSQLQGINGAFEPDVESYFIQEKGSSYMEEDKKMERYDPEVNIDSEYYGLLPKEDSFVNDNNNSSSEESDEFNNDDFLGLLGQFDKDDPIAEDVLAISDMLQGNLIPVELDEELLPSDVGEVFSNALKAIDTLADGEGDDASLTPLPSEIKGKKKRESKADKKVKAAKKSKSNKKAKIKTESSVKVPKKEKGAFGRLFRNVVDEKAVNQIAKAEAAGTQGVANISDIKKKNKKNKKIKNISVDVANQEEIGTENNSNKNEKKTKEKKIKEKKTKTPKIELVDISDAYEETTRINKVGASIVFAFFGVLVVILLIWTNIFSYTLSIRNATSYFNRHEYTEAYNQVNGLEIKDDDLEIYNKIQTVMFVNKQLNSYNHYFAMGRYPEALDSLLKGLRRYDKYVELGTMLGIKSDLDYVREQLLAELSMEFNLSEERALDIIGIENQTKYSIEVYDIVQENKLYVE